MSWATFAVTETAGTCAGDPFQAELRQVLRRLDIPRGGPRETCGLIFIDTHEDPAIALDVLLDQAEGTRDHVEAECDDEQAHAPGAVFA